MNKLRPIPTWKIVLTFWPLTFLKTFWVMWPIFRPVGNAGLQKCSKRGEYSIYWFGNKRGTKSFRLIFLVYVSNVLCERCLFSVSWPICMWRAVISRVNLLNTLFCRRYGLLMLFPDSGCCLWADLWKTLYRFWQLTTAVANCIC